MTTYMWKGRPTSKIDRGVSEVGTTKTLKMKKQKNILQNENSPLATHPPSIFLAGMGHYIFDVGEEEKLGDYQKKIRHGKALK